MKSFILENLFTIITTVFGGTSLAGWITERSKRKIEEKQAASDALKSMQSAYDEFTKDSLERYQALKEDVIELKEQLVDVTKQLAEERLKNVNLQVEYKKVLDKLESLENSK